MAQTNRFTGKDMVIQFTTYDGVNDQDVTIDLHADFKTLSVKESMGSAEATAGADGHEYSIPTYAASSIDVETLALDADADEYEDIAEFIQPGVFGDLVYGPEGDKNPEPRFTAAGYIETADIAYPFADVVSLKFTLRCTEAIAEDVWPEEE